MKKTVGEIIFDIILDLIMFVLIMICVYPFLYVIFASFSNPAELMAKEGIMLHPEGFSLAGYQEVLKDNRVWTGYGNTLIYVVAGTFLNLLFSVLTAYALTKQEAFWIKKITILIMFTMFFHGGMIPTYLTVQNLGLLNTRAAIILPSLIGTYNMIVLRTAFAAIPKSLEEAAEIEGANSFMILFRIIVPLSLPTMAVIMLYYGVGHWNSWFSAMIYLKDRSKFPLQLILREILINSSIEDSALMSGSGDKAAMQEVVKYCTIIVSTAPILCLYPYLQKYFVKGVMIGAVKG